MRNRLPLILLLLLAGLLGSAPVAWASHLLGGDMTYVSLGNNQYRVKFRLYRDCSGIAPTTFDLNCKNNGCSSTATVQATFVQTGSVQAGNPFCAAVSAGPCQGPAGLPSYDVYEYLASVTLPPGQWILSTSQSARPALANIVAGDLYVEATLDNRNQGTTAVANNSPQFDPQDIPIQYVCWKQRTTITYSSTEPDGDSLVYSLAAPLQACATPVTYNAYPSIAPVITQSPGCTFTFSGQASGTYSPTYPIQLGLDTVGTCPLRTGVVRPFVFNQQARTITFTPGIYNSATSPASGANKYQIAVLITEYRRINGVRRVIGTVRREATLIVMDCGTNATPNPVQSNPVTINSGTNVVNTADTTRIDVRSCNYSRVELNFTDPDNIRTPSANQLLTVTLPANINTDPNLLDSGDVGSFSLSGNGTTNPKGVFFFQPSPATVGRIIRLNVRVEDNACPVKGVQNRVIVIRVLRGNFAMVSLNNPPVLCLGSSTVLQGRVLRPDSIRRIVTNTTQAQLYSFQWTASVGGNGLPAVTNTRDIAVNPTVTTRYLLRISPVLGFAQGVCGDTASVLVRVLPAVAPPVVTRNGLTLTSSYATGNQWFRNAQVVPGATGQNLTVNNSGTYTVQAYVAGSQGSCVSPASAALTVLSAVRAQPGTSLSVVPNPTPDGRLQVTLTGYAQPVTLTVLDALGRKVSAAMVPAPNPQGSTQELNLSGCEAGLYLLQVRTASSLEVRRIVRQ
ncbi:T9SS type A sorting domain-containing protein [Hymenobacter sp. M29]|uniref:T9SS type A sorting domain-containing protein n=1 Tax=Hymenobacter mellowenesis TaxID=3063995 RepID=A0ABT9AEY5_9BACT|nr:T9SS type A sorting domain-containing protein [Hymenobacter sp. M29]MDO7848414.1 T9SS type A sorting domain-containing protein [Hymenobacter sp. M29]